MVKLVVEDNFRLVGKDVLNFNSCYAMNGLQNSIIKKRVKPIKYSINNLYATPGYILMKTTGNT